jgi:CheY-like chemotaxis protein
MGTRVSLFFPRANADAKARTDSADDSTPSGHGEVVLVVEDDADVRLVTISRLEGLGYRVRMAPDGPSALETLARSPDVQLAIVDVVMPGGMDGHAVADEIDRRRPDVKVILTSGYSPRLAAAGARDARPFLPKPSTRSQLAQLVHRTLHPKS